MRTRATACIAFLLISGFAAATAAQIAVGKTDADRAEFARHRAALFERLGDEVAVLLGTYSRPDMLRFKQDNSFYYLTGVEFPFAALVMDGRSDKAILFLPPERTGQQAVFNGPRIGPGPEAVAEFGIEDVRPNAQLEEVVKELAPEGGKVFTSLLPEETVVSAQDSAMGAIRAAARIPWAKRQTRAERIKEWLEGLVPGVTVEDIGPEIDDLRRVKSPWEIELLIESARIAGSGHLAAMRATRPGVKEWQIEAAAVGAFRAGGAMHDGYVPIVTSGPNNNILHYASSADTADDGELVLMDFGPVYRYYVADITRTWPVSGKFTEEQRKAYLDCLQIQQQLIEAVKPGVTLQYLTVLNLRLANEMGYSADYLHGPSHPLGMGVHDVGSWAKPLEPGVVITVEPGLYFLDQGWGIRIEDFVVVTEDGCRVLSDMIPKHPDEIEAVMAGSAEDGDQ